MQLITIYPIINYLLKAISQKDDNPREMSDTEIMIIALVAVAIIYFYGMHSRACS
jgi:hypothetical protein